MLHGATWHARSDSARLFSYSFMENQDTNNTCTLADMHNIRADVSEPAIRKRCCIGVQTPLSPYRSDSIPMAIQSTSQPKIGPSLGDYCRLIGRSTEPRHVCASMGPTLWTTTWLVHRQPVPRECGAGAQVPRVIRPCFCRVPGADGASLLLNPHSGDSLSDFASFPPSFRA